MFTNVTFSVSPFHIAWKYLVNNKDRSWAIPDVGLQHGKPLNGLATFALPSEWRCAL